LLIAASSLTAAITQTFDYQYRQPSDRIALFTIAITPEQDLLSFGVSEQGNWHLTRVREWHTLRPGEQTLDVPGFQFIASGTEQSIEIRSVVDNSGRLFVTQDGRFAACVAMYAWRRTDHEEAEAEHGDVVSVIDLREWRVIKTTVRHQMKGVWFGGWRMDQGQLALFDKARLPSPDSPDRVGVKLTLLDVQSLNFIGQCSYTERYIRSSVASEKDIDVLDDNGSCDALITRVQVSQAPSLAEFRLRPIAPRKTRRTSDCAYAGSSPGDQFEMESCMTFDSPLRRARRDDIFSSRTGAKVGSINGYLSIQSAFAVNNGQTFLLTLESGTRLRVYSITE
jgi:hypothetical protein